MADKPVSDVDEIIIHARLFGGVGGLEEFEMVDKNVMLLPVQVD
jgi:hypothetical protein